MKFHVGFRLALAFLLAFGLTVAVFFGGRSSNFSTGRGVAQAHALPADKSQADAHDPVCDASIYDLNRRLPEAWSPANATPNDAFIVSNGVRLARPSVTARPNASSQIVDITVAPDGDLSFNPSTVHINVGDTVRWTWEASGHSVTGGTPCTSNNSFCSPDNNNCNLGQASNQGTVYTHTFTQAGTFPFFCTPHCSFGMTGTITVNAVVIRPTANDFDGDGKADVAVYRPSSGSWYVLLSGNNSFDAQNFGASTDLITPGDFDGDHKTDRSVFRPSEGNWYSLHSGNGSFNATHFGAGTDVPVAGDFDGDGKADLAVFRPSEGNWFILQSSNGAFRFVNFGLNGDIPVAGDYDGDGKADIAVFRPSSGSWFILRSSDNAFVSQAFGATGDRPVPADYDGDNKTDIAVYRPNGGGWFLLRSTGGFTGVAFGISTDIPAPSDYDGDGKADIAVYRDGAWYQLLSSNGAFQSVGFGLAGDKPVPAAYIP